jgi:hypothetical protein
MKAQFLKMAGVNSEEEFYNMYPTEDAFFQNYPEARQMAHGGATYPYPGQATADQFFNYGMQGRGAGSQIPVESYYAYGGSSNGPLGYFNDGGSAWNYGQFPAFAKGGDQVQGGKIDNVVDANKTNFLSAIQKNTNNALMKEASDEAYQMTQFAQYGQQTGSQFNPNMYNQNMYVDASNSMNRESAYANRNVLGLAKFFTNNAIDRKMQSYTDQQKAQDEYYKKLQTEPGFKDAQTVPGFDPIPGNMAKLGGSLKKYQTAGTTGTPDYASPTPLVSELDLNLIIADTQKAGKTAAQKRKDDAELKKIENLKLQRDFDLKRYTDNPEGFYNNPTYTGSTSGSLAGTTAYTSEQLATTLKFSNQAYIDAYNNYLISRNLGSPYTSKGTFIEKYNPVPGSAKTAAQHVSKIPSTYQPFNVQYGQVTESQEQTPDSVVQAATTPAPAAKKAPAAAQAKPKIDTVYTGVKSYLPSKKQGGQLKKYQAGASTGQVSTVNVAADGSQQIIYADGRIEIKDASGNIMSTTSATQKEGVPPMTYKPGTGAATTTPTTTPVATTGEMSAEEKAVRDFATAKGQNPDEVWQNYQNITSSSGNMGAGTQQPYGYGVSGMVPYRYKHRGYGAIGLDRGYVPGVGDLAAMQKQANSMGYAFTGKSRPTLFGGRRVVIKTHYNPATGKVENKPVIEESAEPATSNLGLTDFQKSNEGASAGMASDSEGRDIMVNQEPFTTNIPSREDLIAQGLERRGFFVNYPVVPNTNAPTANPIRGFENADEEPWHPPLQRQGGALNRFLPKHQVMGETGFKFDNLDMNVPIMDTFHNIKTGLTSINDFKQQKVDARREKRGTDEKAVWKTGPSPYAADATLTGMAALTNMARGKERRALEEKLALGKMSDNLFTSVGMNQGDYVPTGQEYGMFRPDQTTPIFDSGYERGNAGRQSYGKIGGQFDRGGSTAYSDWSQTPVNGYYGVPQGEFNPYSQWSQAPVMQSGGAMMQDGVYDLTEDEINEIIQMGGQVEFLD